MDSVKENLKGQTERQASRFQGISRCSLYAFGPNRLHYCGPDANREILAYMNAGEEDAGLTKMLKNFATMYPYLDFISRVNKINDPFADQVVEAYWLGNSLLNNVSRQNFYRHLIDEHKLKQRLSLREFDKMLDKIGQGALPHHSFHVMNISRRTGHLDVTHTLESIDACRVSWGKVRQIAGPNIEVDYQPLVLENNKLRLGEKVIKKITRQLDSDLDGIKVGDIISMHWHVPCEVLSDVQIKNLKYYTQLSISFANQTL